LNYIKFTKKSYEDLYHTYVRKPRQEPIDIYVVEKMKILSSLDMFAFIYCSKFKHVDNTLGVNPLLPKEARIGTHVFKAILKSLFGDFLLILIITRVPCAVAIGKIKVKVISNFLETKITRIP